MAIDRENSNYDLGHGTRNGFRIASVLGVLLFVAFIAYFAVGPRISVSDSPAGDTNTPVESMAAPKQQETSATNPAPATAPQSPQQQPSP